MTLLTERVEKNQSFRSHLLNCGFKMLTKETYQLGNWLVYVQFYPVKHGVIATNLVTDDKHKLGMLTSIEDFRKLVGKCKTANLKAV